MSNYKAIFRSFTKEKKNSIFTRRAIKSELIIPNGAAEISDEEMEYIIGGEVRVERYGFLGLGVKIVFEGTVAELLGYVSDAIAIIGIGVALLSFIPRIGNAAAVKWIALGTSTLCYISSQIAKSKWARNTPFKFEVNLI